MQSGQISSTEAAVTILKKRKKLFIFDRDDTLVDKNNKLINADKIIPLLKHISTFGIASNGALALDDKFAILQDAAVRLLMLEGISFCSALYSQKASNQRIELLFDEVDRAAVMQIKNRLDENEEKVADQRTDPFENVSFPLKITIGHTIISVNKEAFLSKVIFDGKNIAIFELLDNANLRLSDVDLQHIAGKLGIELITYDAKAQTYTEIKSQDIVIVDDKTSVCRQARVFGFTGIIADTTARHLCARKKLESAKEYLEQNKLIQLNEMLNEVVREYLNDEECGQYFHAYPQNTVLNDKKLLAKKLLFITDLIEYQSKDAYLNKIIEAGNLEFFALMNNIGNVKDLNARLIRKMLTPGFDFNSLELNSAAGRNTFGNMKILAKNELFKEVKDLLKDLELKPDTIKTTQLGKAFELLNKAEYHPLFNQHRNNSVFFGAFGRTATVKAIQAEKAKVLRLLGEHEKRLGCCY